MLKTASRSPRSLVAGAAAVLLLPGLLAACSSASSHDSDSSGAGSSGGGTTVTSCLRNKGYDIQDPSSHEMLDLSAPKGADEQQWNTDLQFCMGGQGGAGESGAQEAKRVPGAEKKLKQMAKCIRDGGFSDFPDGQDAMVTYQPNDKAAFEEVSEKCSEQAFGRGGEALEQ